MTLSFMEEIQNPKKKIIKTSGNLEKVYYLDIFLSVTKDSITIKTLI